MATTPYLIGSNGVSSADVLTINVATTTSNGDSLKLGITVNTANAIPSVLDSQGNQWNLITSSVTETGAQLYVFEAAGAAALVASVDTITIETAGP